MPTYQTPGVYLEEVALGPKPIEAVGTSTFGVVGRAPDPEARVNRATAVTNWPQFRSLFCPPGSRSTPLTQAVFGFFANGGQLCHVVNTGEGDRLTSGAERVGLDVLRTLDDVAIVAAPGHTGADAYDALREHCESMGDRVAILDPPYEVPDLAALTRAATSGRPDAGGAGSAGGSGSGAGGDAGGEGSAGPGAAGESGGARGSGAPGRARGTVDEEPLALGPMDSAKGHTAFYFPWIVVRDPLSGDLVEVAPSGHIAGLWARSDATRGVYKAPANEALRGALDLRYRVTSAEQANLNANGVNCIRYFSSEGIKVWGARTTASDPEWRYLNVRRLVIMIEQSIIRSTRWIVFEPNASPLWRLITADITAFLMRMWRAGALRGATPAQAFFVQCDETTNPAESVDAGEVTTMIGLAPVKPAEFVIFRISQFAEGSSTSEGSGTDV